MKKSYVLLLVVFDVTLCHKGVGNKQLRNQKCPNIKCPNDEKPVCVQVINKSTRNNKPIHIIMINECEMEYMKCHQGLSATVVPMKNCGHDDLKKIQTVIKAKKSKKDRLTLRKNLNQPLSIKTLELKADNSDQGTKSSSENFEDGDKESAGNEEHSPALSETAKSVNPDNDEFKSASNEERSDEEAVLDDVQSEVKASNTSFEDSINESFHKDDILVSKQLSDNDSMNIGSEEKHNIVDLDYEAVCPSSCPIRDVMVCAKCRHGVYRTFTSVCHMRMFNCEQKDEVLELVSRQPCIMSAPYIMDDDDLQGNQRISEPNDEDNVLTYIMCREQASAEDSRLQNLRHNQQYYIKCNNYNRELINKDTDYKKSVMKGIVSDYHWTY